MKILLIADVVAKAGRELLEMFIPSLIQEYSLDFVVANGENLEIFLDRFATNEPVKSAVRTSNT